MMGEGVGLEQSFEEIYNNLLDSHGFESPCIFEEESRHKDVPVQPESNCKGQIDSCIDMTEEPGPLGLTLHKNSSFLDLIDMNISQKKINSLNKPTSSTNMEKQKTRNDKNNMQPPPMKWKASNFPASKLKIGCWERKSTNEGDIVAKFYYAKRKLVWEILEERLKQKLEIQWTDISAIRAHFIKDQPGILEIELRQQPMFFNEVNPQPRKHTNWEACSDFTGGNATKYRMHYLEFPEGTLEKHYKRLLCSDNRLRTLTQKVFSSPDSRLFETVNSGAKDICMLKPNFPSILNQPSGNWCSPHLSHINNQGSASTRYCTFESLVPSVGANYPHSLLKPTPGVTQMNSPMSVMECPQPMNQAASCLNPRTSYLADNFALNNDNTRTNSTPNRMTQLCNQDIQSSRSVDAISECQIQQLPPDLQSLAEQLLSDSDDVHPFASDDSRVLSKVKAIGALIYFTDSQPRSSNGLDDSNQNTDVIDESRDTKQFDNKEQIDMSSLFQKIDHVDSHSYCIYDRPVWPCSNCQ